jgi:hypothetical protein
MTNASGKTKPIHIFVNWRELEVEQTTLTGAQLLALAGFEGRDGAPPPSNFLIFALQSWDLFRVHGEGDSSGEELILAGQELTPEDGQHFRIRAGNGTFGT